jgi:hypothetical protein
VNGFDVSVYSIRRRPGRRKPFEVRWQAAGRSRSKSFITRRLADSFRAELVRAARTGLEFDPLTGEPTAWNLPARRPRLRGRGRAAAGQPAGHHRLASAAVASSRRPYNDGQPC